MPRTKSRETNPRWERSPRGGDVSAAVRVHHRGEVHALRQKKKQVDPAASPLDESMTATPTCFIHGMGSGRFEFQDFQDSVDILRGLPQKEG